MSRRLVGIFVLSLLLIGIFGFSVIAADTSGTPPTPPSSEDRSQMEAKMKAEKEAFISTLAGNLGVTVDELNAALKETQEQILAEKVANGEITQEQADKMAERDVSFGFGGPGGPGGHGGPGGPPPRDGSVPGSSSQSQ
ncbi:MAG: hypothetical protein HPY50_21120 [Firmicutes bacterium]|nr:hypothetical protein [Bacillota bacterium]